MRGKLYFGDVPCYAPKHRRSRLISHDRLPIPSSVPPDRPLGCPRHDRSRNQRPANETVGKCGCQCKLDNFEAFGLYCVGSIQDANSAKRRGRNAFALAAKPRNVRHTNVGVSR